MRNILNVINMAAIYLSQATSAEDIVNQVVSPLKAIITIIIAILEVAGVFVVVKNVPTLATGIKERDDNGITTGILGMGAGVMLMAVGAILVLFGYKG